MDSPLAKKPQSLTGGALVSFMVNSSDTISDAVKLAQQNRPVVVLLHPLLCSSVTVDIVPSYPST